MTYFDQRDHPGARQMVGSFLSPAPLRIPLARDVPLASAFQPMVENVLAAYRRAYMPAVHYLSAYPAAMPALLGQSAPWFFVVQYQPHSGPQSYRFGDACGPIVHAGTVSRQEPGMTLRLRRAQDGELWLRIGYDLKQWRSDSISALADRYGRALRAMMKDPSRTPAQLLEAVESW